MTYIDKLKRAVLQIVSCEETLERLHTPTPSHSVLSRYPPSDPEERERIRLGWISFVNKKKRLWETVLDDLLEVSHERHNH